MLLRYAYFIQFRSSSLPSFLTGLAYRDKNTDTAFPYNSPLPALAAALDSHPRRGV